MCSEFDIRMKHMHQQCQLSILAAVATSNARLFFFVRFKVVIFEQTGIDFVELASVYVRLNTEKLFEQFRLNVNFKQFIKFPIDKFFASISLSCGWVQQLEQPKY